jgi:hypothetical protein
MPKKQAKKAAKKQSKEQLTLAVLSRARQLIAKGWTRGDMATSKDGRHTDPRSNTACRFCAMGAVVRASADLTGDNLDDAYINKTTKGALDQLRELVGPSVGKFNDEQTSKRPVLAAFDQAIAKLEAQ